MADENKEIKKEEAPAAAGPAGDAKPKEAPKEAAPVKKEKPANCAACNKSIKKKRWYYRSGKYYCTKRCWKTTLKKEDAKARAPSQ